ncbi:GNAT family N-acetyltransferase [Acidaminobacterium chupaoyuni]
MYQIDPMTAAYAESICQWQYPGEYAVYSFEKNQETLSELMNGEYFSCVNAAGDLIGYFCFGGSAQIPTETSYTADEDKIDIGLGLSPALCGHGYGREFLKSGLRCAEQRFCAKGFRLVVAAFNKRAIALYHSCGFQEIGRIRHKKSNTLFVVMSRSV